MMIKTYDAGRRSVQIKYVSTLHNCIYVSQHNHVYLESNIIPLITMYLPNVLLLRLMDFISIASVDCSEIVVFILKEPAHTVLKKMDKKREV